MFSIASFTLGIFFQITQFIRLYSYSKNKYYREEYIKVMKKYGIKDLNEIIGGAH